MRFVSFTSIDPAPRVGVQVGRLVIDLSAAAPLAFDEVEGLRWGLVDILRGEPQGMGVDGAAEIAAAVLDQLGIESVEELEGGESTGGNGAHDAGLPGALSIGGTEMLLSLAEVRLLAPLLRPANLRLYAAFEQSALALAQAYGRHLAPEWYDAPSFAYGNCSTVIGTGADLPMPQTHALDYTLEVACVIGRYGQDIAPEDAEQYIAGYTIVNNWIARDRQRDELALGLGPSKSADFATSLGPALVTPDELASSLLADGRYHLTMVARVNGVERSRGTLRDMFYTFADLVAHASRDTPLEPGDLLSSGPLPAGCLLELTGGRGPWLTPGDLVELEVAGLGVLRNAIVPRDS